MTNARVNKNGYVAISSVLVIGAVLVVVGISLSVNAINELQQSFGEGRKERAVGLVESCAEEGLKRIRDTDSLPGSILLPEGSCNVTINSHIGNAWQFTVSGDFDGYLKTIQVAANRTSTMEVTSWLEI